MNQAGDEMEDKRQLFCRLDFCQLKSAWEQLDTLWPVIWNWTNGIEKCNMFVQICPVVIMV